MAQDKNCNSCPQSHDCKKIYEVMGKAKGPCVLVKVVFAFLVPLAVFIVSLVIFESILANMTDSKALQAGLGALLAATLAFVVILITKEIIRRI